MRRIPLILITAIVIVAIGLIWTIYFNKQRPIPTNNTNTQISQLSLRNICDCYLVTGSMGGGVIYDLSTGQKVSHQLWAGSTGSTAIKSYFSPSGKYLGATVDANKVLAITEFPNSTVRNIYTAPSGNIIDGVDWALDESAIVVGIRDSNFTPPNEGTYPTGLISINPETGESETLLTKQDINKIGGDYAIPLVISTNAKSMVLILIKDDQNFVRLWQDGKITSLDSGPGDGWPSMSSFAENHTYLVWNYIGKLIRLDLDSGEKKEFILPDWYEGVYPGTSPDGRSMVFLQRKTNQDVALALIDIISGETQQISTIDASLNDGIGTLVWTPNGKYIIYFDPKNINTYYSLQVSDQVKALQKINLPQQSSDLIPYLLIPK